MIKKLMNKIVSKIRNNKAFTLLEMAIVLFIVGVLLLIVIPNISDQRNAADTQGTEALEKVVESQSLLYEIEHDQKPTYELLLQSGYLDADQVQKAQESNIALP